jgi:cell pole-organizing protein PopZ
MTDSDLPEPSMEEILASIRRIISNDEVDPAHGAVASTSEASDDDVLILTERAPPELPVAAESPPLAAQPAGAGRAEGGLVSPETAVSAAASFQKLSFVVDNSVQAARLPAAPPSPTLEDLTRDLMRPMLQSWLDQNLDAIVRARVDEEVERITRGRVR